MNEIMDPAEFLVPFLEREGALAEHAGGGAVAAVVPVALARSLATPESGTYRVFGEPGAGDVPLPLESQGMQWCLDRALGRGRCAAVELPSVHPRRRGVIESVMERVGAANGSLRPKSSSVRPFTAWILDFAYAAVGEDRTDGNILLATSPEAAVVSADLAAAVLARLCEARPVPGTIEPEAMRAAAARADGIVRDEIARRLESFRNRLAGRLQRDAERIRDYHATLRREAGRRRRVVPEDGTATARVAAIDRAEQEKLAELEARHAVTARYTLASVLVATYSSAAVDLVLLRRKREIPLTVFLDPLLNAPLPLGCASCAAPAFVLHACDEHGHLTCPRCAAPCPSCARVTCRRCEPAGCRSCRSAAAGG